MPNENIVARWLRNFKGDSSDINDEDCLEDTE